MGRWLFLPDTVLDDLEILARATVERIGKLRSLLDSPKGFRTFEVYLRVAEILAISDQEAAGLYSFWEYVQQERAENEKSGLDTVGEFVSFLEGKAASRKSPEDEKRLRQILRDITEKRTALTALFEDCPKREFARKSALLESGPLPHLADIRTFCDIRPIYNKAGTEIVNQVALITLRLGMHSSHLDENKEVLINLREKDIERLELEFKRLREKMAVLRKSLPIKPSKSKKPTGDHR